ncbi:hypothetical protein K0625_13835 [Shewanella sp. NR704-98]|uniref:Lipoprotein n=2 Tax=Shewanella nanhaiensis TaxID=2864872 RepID=A0ABS7E4Y9_9GAMM|nr:hypothetical protein [Shewanella nanhaiensis]
MLSACNLANHGTFTTQTFKSSDEPLVHLGLVSGESCQTSVLYFIPYENSASTHFAIDDAKGKIEGTVILTDIAIDDEYRFELGYSVQCIKVTATAYGVK